MKEFLILRHRLIPFLYTMNVRASYEDEPLVQPMYWNHKDEAAYTVPNQFYFGPSLMVAPITSPQSKTTGLGGTRAWLPPGRYIDIFSPRLVYDGDREIRIHRLLSKFPVLAKEGSIIPLDSSPKLTNGTSNPTSIEILLVVGRDAHFELVEDCESTAVSARPTLESFLRTPINWNQKTGKLTIGPQSKPSSKTRQWSVKLVGHTSTDLSPFLPGRMTVLREESSTLIQLGEVAAGKGLEVVLGPDLQLDVVDVPNRIREVLYRCETNHQMKETVWKLIVESTALIHTKMARLYELDIDTALRDALVEIWFADVRSLHATERSAATSDLTGTGS
jgi:hypothetical protein